MVADGPPHMISWNVRNGWYPKGRPATTPVCLSCNRSCPDGLRCRFCGRINTDSFTGFLAGLRARFGRVLLFAGNAGHHSPGGSGRGGPGGTATWRYGTSRHTRRS